MTNLTHLSDAELDAVTGGGGGFVNVNISKISLYAFQEQEVNQALVLDAKQNANQSITVVQA
jgi:hypothetical protein